MADTEHRAEPHKPKTVRIPRNLLIEADERWKKLYLSNFNEYVKLLIRQDLDTAQ